MSGQRQRVVCPYCGYKMPIEYDAKDARTRCQGLFVKCKGRSCGKVFEIMIPEKTDK